MKHIFLNKKKTNTNKQKQTIYKNEKLKYKN